MSVDTANGQTSASAATAKIREVVEQYRLPGIDLDGFLTARQADIEAISKATTAAYAGAQTVTEKQADLLRAALDGLKDALTPPSPGNGITAEAVVKKRSELVTSVLTHTFDSMKEMAEAAQHAQLEVFNLAVARVRSNTEQFRTLFAIPKKDN
jgi:hypothetical protein